MSAKALRGEDIMTDFQFKKIIEMVEMIVESSQDKEEILAKVKKLKKKKDDDDD